VAVDLGARPDEVPRTLADLEAYIQSMRTSGALAVGSDARSLARAVLSGPLAAILFPAGWFNRLFTTAWLPEDLRRAYGLPWSDRRARRFERTATIIRRARRLLPDRIALWPEARSTRA
jgi:uncharacterized protein (DUF2236 family)